MDDIKHLTRLLIDFRDARDWSRFHNPKDLAAAVSIEANELLEAFLWKQPSEADRNEVKEELADVFAYCLLLAHHYGFDVTEIVTEKMAANALKYPVEKSKGVSTKYDRL